MAMPAKTVKTVKRKKVFLGLRILPEEKHILEREAKLHRQSLYEYVSGLLSAHVGRRQTSILE